MDVELRPRIADVHRSEKVTPITATPNELPTCYIVDSAPASPPARGRSAYASTVVVSGVIASQHARLAVVVIVLAGPLGLASSGGVRVFRRDGDTVLRTWSGDGSVTNLLCRSDMLLDLTPQGWPGRYRGIAPPRQVRVGPWRCRPLFLGVSGARCWSGHPGGR